jgi:hypothetical protein
MIVSGHRDQIQQGQGRGYQQRDEEPPSEAVWRMNLDIPPAHCVHEAAHAVRLPRLATPRLAQPSVPCPACLAGPCRAEPRRARL